MTIQASAQVPLITITISASDDVADDVVGAVPRPTTTRGMDGSVNFENQNYHVNVGEDGDISIKRGCGREKKAG